MEPREPARLTITPQVSGWMVSLTDYQLAQKVSIRVPHFAGWMDVLEEALRTGSGDWIDVEQGKGYQKLKAERKKLLDVKDDEE